MLFASRTRERVPLGPFDIHLDEIDAAELQVFGHSVERHRAHLEALTMRPFVAHPAM